MTAEQVQAIHDKLDALIFEVRLNRNEERRHGLAIAELQQWRESLEAQNEVANEP